MSVAVASIFKRGKKGTWWIKYYTNGRQIYYSLKTTNERVARRVKREIEGEEAKGELVAPSQTPVPSFLEDFCKFLSTIQTAKSFKNDVSVLRVFFGPVCPALEPGSCVNTRWRSGTTRHVMDKMRHVHVKADFLEEVTGAAIEEFLTRRMRVDSIAPKTANRYREVLHRMFNYAIKNWHFVPTDRRHPNPAAQVERRREPAKFIRFLSEAQIADQLDALSDEPVLQAAVTTLIYAGLRREEVLWLTLEDVDLDQRLIHVRAKTIDGAFTPDGRFHPIPVNLTHEPFRRIWEDNVFRLLLDAGRIDHTVINQIRFWRHTGFSVDRSVRIPAADRDGLERLAQYMARSPFSLTRLLRITRTGQVVYHAEKHRPHRFPEPASDDLFGGVVRNYQVFDPLDFLAELTQHIPNQGEHLVRYYGHYSNKARGLRAKQGDQNENDQPQPDAQANPDSREVRKRWAMLIQRIYQADPLLCPKCGGTMKIIAFIEARQGQVVRQILEHCGLWQDPPPRPHRRSRRAAPRCAIPEADAGVSYEVEPEYLEHPRREVLEEQDQPELSWDA